MRALLFLTLFLIFSCKKDVKKEEKINLLTIKEKLSANLMSVDVSEKNIFDIKYSKKEIDESIILLDSLLKFSNSDYKHYYILLKSKLKFLKNEKREALDLLFKIKKEFPLVFYYNKGIMLEFGGDYEGAKEEYQRASSLCINEQDIFCNEINYLINNDFKKYLNQLENLNPEYFKVIKLNSKEGFRKKTMIEGISFKNFILPSDDDVIVKIDKK